MKIWQSEDDNIQLSMSLLEYRRLFNAVDDHVTEYCSENDILITIFEQMEKFNKGEEK